MKKSAATKLLESMVKGKKYTARQISSKFKVSNPYDLIYKIRGMGVSVETNETLKGAVYFIKV